MKRTIKLLALALMLATISMFTGCNSVTPDKPCTHEHTKTVVIKEATCIEDGLEQTICVDCGKVLDEQKLPIDPENHVWVLESDTATCTKDGVKTYKCRHCNKTKTEDSTALGHNFEGGYCERCGAFEFEDGLKVLVGVYTLENNELVKKEDLWFSFEDKDVEMELNDLIHLKIAYKNYVVTYCSYYSYSDLLSRIKDDWKYIPWSDSLDTAIDIVVELKTE